MCKYSFITYMVSKLIVFLVNKEEQLLLDLCLLYYKLCLLLLFLNPVFNLIIEPSIAKACQLLYYFLQIPPNILAKFSNHAFIIINHNGKIICRQYYDYVLVIRVYNYLEKILVMKIYPTYTYAYDLREILCNSQCPNSGNQIFT